MTSFHDLPDETVSTIFSYLNPLDYQSSRYVCQNWKRKLTGCASFSWGVTTATVSRNMESRLVTGMVLKGHRIIQGSTKNHPGDDDDGINTTTSSRFSTRSRSARSDDDDDTMLICMPINNNNNNHSNRLEPRVLSSRMHLANEPPFRFISQRKYVAFSMEHSDSPLVWDTVDLSLSACRMTSIVPTRGKESLPQIPEGEGGVDEGAQPAAVSAATVGSPTNFRRTKVLLKRLLMTIDLSGIQHLKRVSLRGCTHLQTVQVPSSLEALDVSSGPSLSKLIFPPKQDGRLEALNLGGCRSLVSQDKSRLFGSATGDIMRYIRELDFSSTTQLDSHLLADAIRMTSHLECVYLRHVATNPVIRALAESESAKITLRFVDASFSEDLNDEACKELITSAIHLEGLNVRACHSISSSLATAISTRLQNRRNKETQDQSIVQRIPIETSSNLSDIGSRSQPNDL